MTRIRDIKTTFTAGEVSRDLLGRGDLRAYDNGALTLRNVFINPTGGVTRRSSLGYIDTAAGDGKVIAFEFNTQQTALLVITDEQIDIDITDFDSPTVVSGTVIPKPNPDYDSEVMGSEELLYLPDTDATIDWFEQAFSPARGYLVTVAFHQDRLVIGGSRDLPNRLWFSKSGDLFNFDLGEGLDDEAIEFSILSDQVNAIRGIFSSRHLQVFTSGAEWMVTGDPLTPVSVQIRRQTRTGSRIDRYIPPVNVDGATLYCARSGQELYEFLYTDLEQAYTSTDLALLSRDIIGTPIDQDYDQKNRLLFVVRADGKFATLTVFRAEKVSAWTQHETNGLVKSVAVVGDEVYMLVLRDGDYFIEQFDASLNLDSALSGQVGSPASLWSGLDHLEDQVVSIVADGVVLPDETVLGGSVTLSEPASDVQIGLAYTHIVEPLPPNEVGRVGVGRKLRLIEAIFRIKDTASLRLDIGRGLKDVSLKDFGDTIMLDDPNPLVSGDVRVRDLGWQKEGVTPLWRIEQNLPLPFTLLSVATEIKVND